MCKLSYKKLELEKSVRTSLNIYYFDEVVQAVSVKIKQIWDFFFWYGCLHEFISAIEFDQLLKDIMKIDI